ncbi:SUKH-4 family immunity protein [Spirillospora sp. NPDC127200]
MSERLTRERLAEVFGEENLLRADPADIPSAVSDEFTREFLVNVGIPQSSEAEFIEFAADFPREWRPLGEAEIYRTGGRQVPDVLKDAFYIGYAEGAVPIFIALDGASGRVHAISEAEDEPYLMNSDVESLVFYMYVLDRHRELYSDEYDDEHSEEYEARGTTTFAEAAKLVEREWREHDPAPLDLPEGEVMRVWPNRLDDIESGMVG